MRVLCDTSVIVQGLVATLPRFHRAARWLDRAKAQQLDLTVASHTLAETYATLTVLPQRPRLTPGEACLIIRDLSSYVRVISLSASDYHAVIREMADLGVVSGGIYDALIARAARKAKVEKLLTFNVTDFRRIWPEGGSIVCEP